MRQPIITRKRSFKAKDLALFGLLLVSVGFLVFTITYRSKEEVDGPTRIPGPKIQPQSALFEKQSPVLENEGDFFIEKDIGTKSLVKTGRGEFPRIFCMVPSQPHAREKFRTILDTWGPWCDGIRFMIDPKQYSEVGKEHLQPEEELEEITSSDGSISAKIVRMNKLVRKKGNDCFTGGSAWNPVTQKMEPVFTACRHIWEKVDDDTYFFVPTMREVILEKGFKPDEHHYFGQRVYPIGPDRPIIAGALVGFSRATLKRVVVEYKQMPREYGDRRNFKHGRCVDRDGATEEVTTSICVRQIGVQPEPLYDEKIVPRRPHMLLWMPRDMLTFSRRDNSSSWFYKHAPRDVGTLENCCSYRPVGFHFMRRDEDLLRVHDLIIDPENKKELEEAVATKVPQWRQMGEKRMNSIFDHSYYKANGCALEAEYLLKVKQTWHSQDPRHYERKLYD